MSGNDKAAAEKPVVCSCCGSKLVDAVVEHAWFEQPTPWVVDFKGIVETFGETERAVDVEDLLALFVGVRVPILARQLTGRNRARLLDMRYEKQLAVILELVARGLLS